MPQNQMQNSPFSFDASLEAARTAHEQGDFATARQGYNALLKTQPQNPEVLHLSGVLFFQQGGLEQAKPLVVAATQLEPQNHRYHNSLGLIERNMSNANAALVSFQTALVHKPDYGEAFANMGLVYIDKKNYPKALESLQKALVLMPENTEVLTNYAHTLRDTGQLESAVKVYRHIVALCPGSERYLLNLGAIEMMADNHQEALQAYEAVLALNPQEPTAQHIVAGLKGQTTNTAPDDYVASLFDVYAHDFDRHLESLGYQVPEMLSKYIPSTVAPHAPQGEWRVLDLGCGTGACGPFFTEFKALLVGVDLAQKMLDKAEEHGVYDALHKKGLSDYLVEENRAFDMVLAADVYVYLGALDTIFAAIAQCLPVGGVYGFSTELATEDEKPFTLRPTGRYAHQDSYIRSLAMQNHLDVKICDDIIVRKDAKGTIDGKLYILQKK